jgi:hypothetical protein
VAQGEGEPQGEEAPRTTRGGRRPRAQADPGAAIPPGGVSLTPGRGSTVELTASSKPREQPEERRSRLAREEAEAWHKRCRDSVLFAVSMFVVASIFGLCCWAFTSASTSPEDKKWATGVIGLIAGGLVGRLTKAE